MKVAIITLSPYANMGGILQAYALQHIVKKMGHNCEQLCWWKLPYPIAYRTLRELVFVMNHLPKALQQWLYKHLPEAANRPISKAIISQNTYQFINQYITYSPIPINKLKENDFDVYIAGSDQLWRYFERTFDCRTFLDFTSNWNVKRFSYAASFGKDNIDDYPLKYKEKVKTLLKQFNAISVRESTGINICKNELNVDAIQLIDPTLLLSSNEYMNLVSKYRKHLKKNSGLMCYVLDRNEAIDKLANKIAAQKGIEIFQSNSNIDDKSLPPYQRIQIPVEQWLEYFNNANCIITDSFHACVFSIIFHKPFLVIGNKQRGMTRFESLLKMFNLEQCLITEDKIEEAQMPNIDYNKVNEILKKEQTKAFAFLKENLN